MAEPEGDSVPLKMMTSDGRELIIGRAWVSETPTELNYTAEILPEYQDQFRSLFEISELNSYSMSTIEETNQGETTDG